MCATEKCILLLGNFCFRSCNMQIKYTLGRGDCGVSVPEDVDEGD